MTLGADFERKRAAVYREVYAEARPYKGEMCIPTYMASIGGRPSYWLWKLAEEAIAQAIEINWMPWGWLTVSRYEGKGTFEINYAVDRPYREVQRERKSSAWDLGDEAEDNYGDDN